MLNTVPASKPQQVHVWTWLQDMVYKLGVDGTSSDDTDTERPHTFFRTKVMPWHRDLHDYWDYIEEVYERYKEDIQGPGGAKPVARVRDSKNRRSNRAVPVVPTVLYKREWIRSIGTERFKHVFTNDIPLKWYKIAES